MIPVTKPSTYIFPILICVVVAITGFIGVGNTNENNALGVGLFSGAACIGSIMVVVGSIFFARSHIVLRDQTKRYNQGKEYWRSTNAARYSNNESNNEGHWESHKGGQSKAYRNPAKGSNSGKHIQNRNDDGTYNDKTDHYYDTWDHPDQSLGMQLLEQVHQEYGVPSLNTNLCTENFSGNIRYDVDLNGSSFRYIQEYAGGKLVDEHVSDQDGYSLENYEDD